MRYNKELANARKSKYLSENGNCCFACGFVFIELRQAHLHHKASKTKRCNVATIWNTTSEISLANEVAKCIPLCKKCHITLHKTYGKEVTEIDTNKYVVTMHKG